MKFGIELPTATSGMMHPVPFQTVTDLVDLAVEAEQWGYYDAGGNDHLSTMQFVRDAWPTPPDYMTRGVDLDAYLDMNLVGTPGRVCAKVAAYEQAGVDRLSALLFVGNTVGEMREQTRMFAEHVLPAFPDSGETA